MAGTFLPQILLHTKKGHFDKKNPTLCCLFEPARVSIFSIAASNRAGPIRSRDGKYGKPRGFK